MFYINRKESGCKESKVSPVLKQNTYCLPAGMGASLEYLTFPILESLHMVEHLVSTRLGGVSEGDLYSMNLSFTRGDRKENVLENYRRIGQVLHCLPENMVASHQTHTTNIRCVTSADRGKGITRDKDYENIDGLITNEPGIALVTYYADCVPLFFVDPVQKAIGLAHSGWRGTVNRIGQCIVNSMVEKFHSNPADIYAAIGPSICQDCYEVGEDMALQYAEEFGFALENSSIVRPGKAPGKYQLNLWRANEVILLESNIAKEHIALTDICTCCNSEYLFSHRASGSRRGNIAAFLMLK